jgi:hypothetical protein
VPAVDPQPGAQAEPEVDAEIAFDTEPEVEAEIAFDTEPEVEAEIAFDTEPEVEFQVEPEVAFEPAAAVPVLLREEGEVEPAWAFPEEPEEEARAARLPPVLLRDRGQQPIAPPTLPDAPATSFARRSLAAVLVIGLAMVGAAGVLWWMPGGSTPGSEVAAVETAPAPTPKPDATPAAPTRPQEAKPQETNVQKITPHAAKPQDAKPQNAKPQNAKPQNAKPQEAKLQEARPQEAKPQEAKPKEVQPTPAALPKDLEIEDLLGQVTPRVEELLADARRLVRIGDIRGAREVLAAPETAHSGALTFLLAETYDPNILPAALKVALADPPRARALYRKARDLGEGRAQGRLDAL